MHIYVVHVRKYVYRSCCRSFSTYTVYVNAIRAVYIHSSLPKAASVGEASESVSECNAVRVCVCVYALVGHNTIRCGKATATAAPTPTHARTWSNVGNRGEISSDWQLSTGLSV